MTDNNTFERFVADHIADDGSGHAQAERLSARIDERTGEHRQLPRWLALIKEPPMRTNSHVAVGSPTVRVVAILAATMLLALALAAAGAGIQRLLAAGPIIVAQDGSGDYRTLTEGVAAARDGDEVLVRPGTYVESVIIDKDIIVRGDGETAGIVLQVPEDGPRIEWPGFRLTHALHLVEADAVVRDMTITTPNASTSGIVVHGGSTTISGMIVDVGSSPRPSARGFVYAGGGATLLIVDNITDGFVWIDEGSNATISGNRMLDGGDGEFGVRVDGAGTHATVVDNELSDSAVWAGASAEFEMARFEGGDSCTLDMRDSGPVRVADSAFSGGSSAICSISVSGLEVTGNTFGDVLSIAMSVSGGDGRIADNAISSSGIGLGLVDSATAVEGNRIEGNSVGVTLLGPANPVSFLGNTICGNTTDIVIGDGGVLADLDGNAICQPPA